LKRLAASPASKVLATGISIQCPVPNDACIARALKVGGSALPNGALHSPPPCVELHSPEEEKEYRNMQSLSWTAANSAGPGRCPGYRLRLDRRHAFSELLARGRCELIFTSQDASLRVQLGAAGMAGCSALVFHAHICETQSRSRFYGYPSDRIRAPVPLSCCAV
jgi:hypothetical protein